MSDNTQWQDPSGTTPPPPAAPAPAPAPSPQDAPPAYGERVPPADPAAPSAPGYAAPGYPPPGYTTPPYAAPGSYAPGGGYQPPAAPYGNPVPGGYPPQLGWAPPPKPGLIPLQPMTLGTILGASFRVMRRNPRPTFGVSLALNGIVAIIALLVVGLVSAFAGSASEVDPTDVSASFSNALAGPDSIGTYVQAALLFFATAILQGIISMEVARGTLGEKLPFRTLWALTKGRIWALIGWSLLSSIVVAVVLTVVIVLVVLAAFAIGGNGGIAFGVGVGILVLLGSVVIAFWLSTRFALVASGIVVERLSIVNAVRRSWSLTQGYFWRTLGILLLVAVMINIATSIITVPVGLIIGVSTVVGNPSGDLSATSSVGVWTTVASIVISALVGSVTAIITAAVSSLLYLDLRIRKEGLDLELIRFVEARQSGTPLPDPFLPAEQTPYAGPSAGTPAV